MPAADVYASGNSYLGLVRQCGASRHEQVVIARALLKRGHVMDGSLTRTFRRRVQAAS